MGHGLSAFSLCIGILLSGIPAPVVAQTPNPDSQYTGGSDIYVFSDSAGIIITGRLVDLHNGEPVANAQVYSGPAAGTEGRLTNKRGWFRLDLREARFPVDLRIEKPGYSKLQLDITGSDRRRLVFLQSVPAGMGCEAVREAGAPPRQPNEIRVGLRNVLTDQPVSGSATIAVRRLDDGLTRDTLASVAEGKLVLPIESHGIYDVTISVPGFEEVRLYPLPVKYSECDVRHMAGAERQVWLKPLSPPPLPPVGQTKAVDPLDTRMFAPVVEALASSYGPELLVDPRPLGEVVMPSSDSVLDANRSFRIDEDVIRSLIPFDLVFPDSTSLAEVSPAVVDERRSFLQQLGIDEVDIVEGRASPCPGILVPAGHGDVSGCPEASRRLVVLSIPRPGGAYWPGGLDELEQGLEAGHWSVWVTERSEYPDGIMTKIVDYVLAPVADGRWRPVKREVLLYVE